MHVPVSCQLIFLKKYMVFSTDMDSDAAERTAHAEALRTGQQLILQTDTPRLAACDYVPEWLPRTHPSTFPMNSGARPVNMPERVHGLLLLNRFPRSQGQENVHLVMDLFDMLNRHEVNRQTFISLHTKPQLLHIINSIPPPEYEGLLKFIKRPCVGKQHVEGLSTFSSAARTLYHSFKASTRFVIGTSARMSSLRSRNDSCVVMFNHTTIFLTISPYDLTFQLSFELIGHPFDYNDDGSPGVGWPITQVIHEWAFRHAVMHNRCI